LSSINYDLRILMVCLGNICRSPMADGLLRRKVEEQALNVYVDSAGTANYHVGSPPDKRMIETAKSLGTEISGLRGRQFSKKDFQDFDVIYVMDESNLSNIKKLTTNNIERLKVKLILNELYPNESREVPDPYYGSMKDFREVYDLLDEVTDVIIEKIKNGEIR
jgi:protein-tyrosine phosphatase